MVRNRLSYAEAYTEFLKYCAKKERVSITTLVHNFKMDGTELEFKQLYDRGLSINNSEYYKRIRGRIKCH